MRIDFHGSPEPTLGVEWEFALVDRRTRDLRNDASHLFARARPRLPHPDRLHQELLRNTVELVTGVCDTVGEAMADLRATLLPVLAAGDDLAEAAMASCDRVHADVAAGRAPYDGSAAAWLARTGELPRP